MATPPPVDSSQRYPVALRDFCTYQNQPGDSNHMMVTPNPQGGTITTDLTLDAAAVTRDVQTEIISLEKTIGTRPFLVPTQPNLGKSVQWLFNNKSPGRVDYRNSIPPLPPPSHNHAHHMSLDNNADDHPQYMRVDGTRAFANPVTAPPAVATNQLITLAQARTAGLNSTQVEQIIQSQMSYWAQFTLTGPRPGRCKMTGGMAQGYTDGNGNLYVSFAPAGFSTLLTFVYMKLPFPGESMLGWYAYQYMEDQLVLLSMDARGAWIQFIEDIRVDRQALVCLSWMAVGV